MKDRILQNVKKFLELQAPIAGPLLLGFSGGADSLCLLHALLECRRFIPFKLHVAHVDHGWRAESGVEASQLRIEVERWGLPFHWYRLEGVAPTEVAAREARLAFFSTLYGELGCQALLLGHHGDDQSETVLKRLLEGAGLLALGGIQAISTMRGMAVWRPLTTQTKEEIAAWVAKRNLVPIDDRTNTDRRYLRARMRAEILPELAAHFGKEVSANLRRLGETAQELTNYFDKKLERYFAATVRTPAEVTVDFTPFLPLEPLEVKLFLKKWLDREAVFPSHATLQSLLAFLQEGGAAKRVLYRDREIVVARRVVAIKNIDRYEP